MRPNRSSARRRAARSVERSESVDDRDAEAPVSRGPRQPRRGRHRPAPGNRRARGPPPTPVTITTPLTSHATGSEEKPRAKKRAHRAHRSRRELRQAAQQHRQRDAQLETAERRADAEVDALAEREVLADIAALRAVAVRLGEDAVVAVRRSEVRHHPGAPGQRHAAELDLAGGDAEETLGGGLQPEDLLDRLRRDHRVEKVVAERGIEKSRASVLPIARVTVTCPATIRSSGRPAISTALSGSAERRGGDESAEQIVGRPAIPLLDRVDAVALQLTSPRACPDSARAADLAGAAASRCPSGGAARGPPREPEELPEHASGSGQAKRLDDVRCHPRRNRRSALPRSPRSAARAPRCAAA